jgi:signal recognition particle subunit SRP54
MFQNLSQKLTQTIRHMRGISKLTEENMQDMLREIRLALLEADVALPVVKSFISKVKEEANGQDVLVKLTPGQALVGIVHDALKNVLGNEHVPLNFKTQPPAIIMMAGLQGTGKTTSVGKLAKLLTEQKKKVLTVSCDVYRPAAIKQLEMVTQQANAHFFASDISQKPLEIAQSALQYAKTHFFDVILVDTAGRLTVDEAMMQEIKELQQAINPIETLLVVDSMQGQDALNTAVAFHQALTITGAILTKLDGDSRGGVALSVRHLLQIPIKYCGISEKVDGLEIFHPDRLAGRILGMGDILSLVEDAQKSIDQDAADKMMKKMQSGQGFDLNDFLSQITQMQKFGMNNLLDKLPSDVKIPDNVDADKEMKKTQAIILSMTPKERSKPELLKASRKKRIASGSGTQVQDFNKLLTQFEQMQQMMKMFQGKNLFKLMKGLKGMKGMGNMNDMNDVPNMKNMPNLKDFKF